MTLIILGYLLKKLKEHNENPTPSNFSLGIYRLAQKLRLLNAK